MSKGDAGKKSPTDKAPASRKSDPEMKETELEKIAGGLAPTVFLGHGTKKTVR